MAQPSASKLGFWSATAIVVANIIGTGVFASIGYQALSVDRPFAILMIWVVGGLLALCGALSYGELAAAMPRSGGEYNFLSRLFHPSLGFSSAVISLVAGFSAPIAASAYAFGDYLSVLVPGMAAKHWGTILITLMTLLHSLELRIGAGTQNVLTLLKVLLIAGFIIVGLAVPAIEGFSSAPTAEGLNEIFTNGFAVSLVWVAFAYSGWNAAAYITGEVKKPQRTVPRALVLGTTLVTVLFVLLNYVFMRTVPLDEYRQAAMNGQSEFGSFSAIVVFGTVGGKLVTGLIAFALISSVSSMVMIGPRVTATAGEDFRFFRSLARKNKWGIPAWALALQWAIAVLIIQTQSFSDIVNYIGFTLSLFTLFTVAGLYVNRIRKLAPLGAYRTPGYPVVPALFILLSLWMIVFLIKDNPPIALAGFGSLAGALALYFAVRNKSSDDTSDNSDTTSD